MNRDTEKRTKVFVTKFDPSVGLERPISEALVWLGWEKIIGRDARVFLKPNLTWREPMAGVTTTPAFIAALVAVLRERTKNIIVGESDGGYHAFRAEEAFASHGLYDLRDSFGIQIVNLSKMPTENASATVAGREVSVALPSFLLRDIDVFITVPVPKVHAMTYVSLGFKNQWGCLPSPMRLRDHPDFARKLLAINRLIRPRLAMFDGTYFLDQTGPMVGDPIRMGLLIAADDIGAASLACCSIMGINPRKASHLRLAQSETMMPRSLDEITLNRPLAQFQTHRFHLKRSVINWVALAAFHSNLWTRVFYDSMLAGPLHWTLYKIRRNSRIARLLYGATGPPPSEANYWR